jgi:hypothetical protein
MKNLIVALMTVASFSAAADWTDYISFKYVLRNHPSTTASSPVFDREPRVSIAGVSMGAQNACINGNRIQSVYPVKKCSKWGYTRDRDGDRSDEKECLAYTSKKVSAPLQGTRMICETRYSVIAAWERKTGKDYDKDDCNLKREIAYTVNTDFKVWVAKKVSKNSSKYDRKFKGQPLFTEAWSIPSCM